MRQNQLCCLQKYFQTYQGKKSIVQNSMYNVILSEFKNLYLNWQQVLLNIVFCFPGFPIYIDNFPHSRNKGFKLLVPAIGRNRCLIPFLVPSPPSPIKMHIKYEQLISVEHLIPASGRVPCNKCQNPQISFGIQDYRAQCPPCLGQEAPEHSFTPLSSPTQHGEIKMGEPRKTGLGWPCGANGGGEQANIFQWGEGLGEYQGCTLAKMYLSRYQCAGVTILKNQIDPQFISMRPEELGPRARINVLSTYCPLNSWRGQFQKGRTPMCPFNCLA